MTQEWVIRDTNDQYIYISATSWECGTNGLKFYVDDKLVAWFMVWRHFRLAPTKKGE